MKLTWLSALVLILSFLKIPLSKNLEEIFQTSDVRKFAQRDIDREMLSLMLEEMGDVIKMQIANFQISHGIIDVAPDTQVKKDLFTFTIRLTDGLCEDHRP